MKRVLLVRHAAVVLDPARPPPEWALAPHGRADAARLAGWEGFRGISGVVASDEPKAAETARPIAEATRAPLRLDPALGEVDRGSMPILGRDAYAAVVAGYLGGGKVARWEPRGTALARVWHAVKRAAETSTGPVAVVSHGLALSIYLNLRGDQWRRISLPAVAVVDVAADGTPTLVDRFRSPDELLGTTPARAQ